MLAANGDFFDTTFKNGVWHGKRIAHLSSGKKLISYFENG
jgi:hypothetical protein